MVHFRYMHTIYHTPAVIIKSISVGEANKRVWLLTKEFGLIIAVVQGVRKPEAKLRGHLVDYAFVQADLVKGKEVWRLISCEMLHNPLAGQTDSPLARGYVRSLTMLERFMIGEGSHEELFAHTEEIAQLIARDDIDAQYFDTLSLWRIITILGYVAVDEKDEAFFTTAFDQAVLLINTTDAKRMIVAVNQSILESQL